MSCYDNIKERGKRGYKFRAGDLGVYIVLKNKATHGNRKFALSEEEQEDLIAIHDRMERD